MDCKGFLIDLDGVLYVGKSPVAGARDLLDLLESRKIPFSFVSNSTRRCRASVARRLDGLGYSIQEERIFTPPMAAIERLKRKGQKSCHLLTTGDVCQDFLAAGLEVTDVGAEAVVVGDAGPDFTYSRLNLAMRLVFEGADLLAMEMDRYWREPDGLVLSTGPFVRALEYATGRQAELMGKPSPGFFQMGLRYLGIEPKDAGMIGDDIETDVGGAQRSGMKGILVRTGKYRLEDSLASSVRPDLVLDSLADLRRYISW
ncbi:MAG: putative HAD-hydrolase [Methanosaeta sp. PtaU1.Bin028]|nr:MAG: putative HAD-hydrolase [Methanosaeta sp. PtaU1.Bin028]